MALMFEKGIQIPTKSICKTNTVMMRQSKLQYLGANEVYRRVMTQKLPMHGFV